MRIDKNFFDRDTNIVARELLGKKIVRVFDSGEKIEAIITETEAYHGLDDKASHASRKKTERNKIMFDRPGLLYVYLIYGIHHCLNFVTMGKGFPAAVLVRGIRVLNQITGPGRTCKALQIDKSFYGEDLTTSKRIWVESVGTNDRSPAIISSKRIGIDYAGECKNWEWNYKIEL